MLCKGKSERGVTPNIANLAASAQHTAKLSSTNSKRLISYCDASLSGPVPTVSNFFCAVNRRATFFRVPLGVRKGIEQSGILAADMSTTPCRITTCRILSRAHSSDEFEESPSRGAFTFSRVPRATSWRPRLTEPTTRPCFRWDFRDDFGRNPIRRRGGEALSSAKKRDRAAPLAENRRKLSDCLIGPNSGLAILRVAFDDDRSARPARGQHLQPRRWQGGPDQGCLSRCAQYVSTRNPTWAFFHA